MKVINDEMLFKLVMLRGLGYKQHEIADILKVSQTTVVYRLGKLRRLAHINGAEGVFADIVCKYIHCPVPYDTVCMPRYVYDLLREKIKEVDKLKEASEK